MVLPLRVPLTSGASVVDEKTPLAVSRSLLQLFATSLDSLPTEAQKEIGHYALDVIQARVVAFEVCKL